MFTHGGRVTLHLYVELREATISRWCASAKNNYSELCVKLDVLYDYFDIGMECRVCWTVGELFGSINGGEWLMS